MKIAIDTRFPENHHHEGFAYFLEEVLKILVMKNSHHEYIFICDHPLFSQTDLDKNVIVINTSKSSSSKIWRIIKTKSLLKKHNPDIFISCNGSGIYFSQAPHCLIINDLSFLYSSSFTKKIFSFHINRITRLNLQNAGSIVTFSRLVKKDIVASFNVIEEKITVLPFLLKSKFLPINENEKEEVKNKYTQGKNYFAYSGPIQAEKNIINLLKAFSIFKKRQKSDWRLLLSGSLAKNNKKFTKTLNAYKYREDVVIADASEEDKIKITGSAYAVIFPSSWESTGAAVLGPMNCQVPVIASINSSMQEVAGEAALLINPADYADMAEKMMLLYKDESLRNNLVEKGKISAAQNNPERAAELLWKAIRDAFRSGKIS